MHETVTNCLVDLVFDDDNEEQWYKSKNIFWKKNYNFFTFFYDFFPTRLLSTAGLWGRALPTATLRRRGRTLPTSRRWRLRTLNADTFEPFLHIFHKITSHGINKKNFFLWFNVLISHLRLSIVAYIIIFQIVCDFFWH